MLRSGFLPRGALLAASCFVGLLGGGQADASKLNIVHSFCSLPRCKDGAEPYSLLRDNSGNLYGSAAGHGREAGMVFELAGGKKPKVLHGFPHDGSEGKGPGALIIDVSGNLYGTTNSGGAHGGGNVFELSPPAPGEKKWAFRVLYSFCAQQNCADGTGPSSGLTYAGASAGAPYDGVSPLYGETTANAYQLIPGEQGWTESVLASFCLEGGQCPEGHLPGGGLYLDSSGNLFGTTTYGGNSSNSGVAFELNQNGGVWTENVLYIFCSQSGCKDGAEPKGGLVQDASGNLFGTTGQGGRACNSAGLNGATCGVIFQLSPNGGAWEETVLYRFCANKDCKDGANPQSGLSLDASGNLFGTTYDGGGNDIDRNGWGGGVVFRYSNGAYSALYSFCKLASCADGEYPVSGVIPDGAGNLLGTTPLGGANAAGEVFRLTP